MDEAGICHKNEFYELLKEWFWGRDYTCILLTKQKYDEILQFCLDLMNGAHPWSLYIAGIKQAYKWLAKHDAVVLEDESAVLDLCPTKVKMSMPNPPACQHSNPPACQHSSSQPMSRDCSQIFISYIVLIIARGILL